MEIMWVIVIGTSIWVGIDAKSIGAKKGLIGGLFDIGPVGWFFVTLLIWIIGFPAYLVARGKIIKAVAEDLSKKMDSSTSSKLNGNISDIRPCPFCAEDIKKAAKVCKHCGKDL